MSDKINYEKIYSDCADRDRAQLTSGDVQALLEMVACTLYKETIKEWLTAVSGSKDTLLKGLGALSIQVHFAEFALSKYCAGDENWRLTARYAQNGYKF